MKQNTLFSFRWFFCFFALASFLSILQVFGKDDQKSLSKICLINNMGDFAPVDFGYYVYLKSELKNAEDSCDMVVLDIDTPGGGLNVAEKISKIIGAFPGITVAFVNSSAYSAGAILAFSADYVFMREGSKIGAAYPVVQDMQKGGAKSIEDSKVYEKIISALRGNMVGLAEKRSKRLLSELQKENPKYKRLNVRNLSKRLESIFLAMVDPEVVLDLKRDGLALQKGKVLTLSAQQAFRLGVADGVVSDGTDILTFFGKDSVEMDSIYPGLGHRMFKLVTHPLVLSSLSGLGMFGLLLELWSPGWGVAGTIGAVSLVSFVIIQAIGGNPDWLSLILILGGVVLLLLEIFVAPGFGLLGVSGLTMFVFGSMFGLRNVAYAGFGISWVEAFAWSIFALFFGGLTFLLMFCFFAKFKGPKGIVNSSQNMVNSFGDEQWEKYVGMNGVADTDLKPSGKILVGEKCFDALTSGKPIARGAVIQVTGMTQSQLMVVEHSVHERKNNAMR